MPDDDQGQTAPDLGFAEAHLSGGPPSAVLQLSDSDGWLGYLSILQTSSTSSFSDSWAIQQFRRLEPAAFNQQQRADLVELEQFLLATFGIGQGELYEMASHCPFFLCAPLSTVKAAAHLLTSQGSSAGSRHYAVVKQPRILMASVEVLTDQLQWLTGALGASADTAVSRFLPWTVTARISTALEPRRLWFAEQGFSPAQILSLAGPWLYSVQTAKLQRRLDFLIHTCGGPPADVRQCLKAASPFWQKDVASHVTKLKLQYWQDELGYSLSDLQLFPTYLKYRTTHVASRVSVQRDFLCLPFTVYHLRDMIAGKLFDARARTMCMEKYLREHSTGSSFFEYLSGAAVGEVFLPLVARLNQPDMQDKWRQALIGAVRPKGGPTSRALGQRKLYDTLYATCEADWIMSADGRHWSALEEEAEAADAADAAARWSLRVAVAADKAQEKASKREARGLAAEASLSKGKASRLAMDGAEAAEAALNTLQNLVSAAPAALKKGSRQPRTRAASVKKLSKAAAGIATSGPLVAGALPA